MTGSLRVGSGLWRDALMAADMTPAVSPLLTDLYQLNMIQAYLDHGETKPAVFEFFMRSLPARRRFLVTAGPAQGLDFLSTPRFSPPGPGGVRPPARPPPPPLHFPLPPP